MLTILLPFRPIPLYCRSFQSLGEFLHVFLGFDTAGLPPLVTGELDVEAAKEGRPLFLGRDFPALHRWSEIACLKANRDNYSFFCAT